MEWNSILGELDAHVMKMVNSIGDNSPHIAVENDYDNEIIQWWTSGFWPGILWLMYDMTGRNLYKDAAWNWDERMSTILGRFHQEVHHDLGFQFLPSSVIKYKITGDEKAKNISLAAATQLSGRFNPVGFLRAWNGNDTEGYAIIDSAMNLSLLFWASHETGDPRFANVAKIHANTLLKHFIRDDGSVNHIVDFDPETGSCKGVVGGQGYSETSAWSRGQAWAIYGMANCYKYTGNRTYLNAAKKVADFFIAHLPDDGIPYWDFLLPSFDNEPRDTSAAACAASGMLEISKHLKKEGRLYQLTAEKIVRSLYQSYSKISEPESCSILSGGTGNRPANINIDVSIIYGDYFFVEAVAKLIGWKKDIF